MPPKNKKQKEIVQDERLQAIILTDSYQTRFEPVSSQSPRCLLPLANVPLIEYTLEFLANSGVDEVYVMCRSHASQIQDYLEKSKWSQRNSPFKVQTVLSLESRSVGDAMRDLDNRGLITGDFVLISGDVVTNMSLEPVLKTHRQRRFQDKDHMLTMVLMEASPYHRSRSDTEPATFMVDRATGKCLYYEQIGGAKKAVSIDPELLTGIDEFEIRNDLVDCHVDICAPQVPLIFQENFDYQELRNDFVRGILASDILQKTVYAHITNQYAARVESWSTYHAISQDIMERWTYPVAPESNVIDGTSYIHMGEHIYKENDVILAQTSRLQRCVVIGGGSFVGAETNIVCSCVGKNVRIGEGVQLKNSYIWDDVVLENGVEATGAVVASGALIRAGAKLLPGAIVGFNEEVPAGAEVAASESEMPQLKFSESAAHDDGLFDLSDTSITSLPGTGSRRKGRTLSTTSYYSEFDSDADGLRDEDDFDKEAMATVTRSMENNHDLDTALLELNTLRMSMNVSYHELRLATTKALLARIEHFVATQTLSLTEATNKIFRKWGLLFRRQVFETEEQIDLLNVLQQQCLELENRSDAASILMRALYILYDEGIVEEDQIYAWWDAPESNASEELIEVKAPTGKWVQWLREAEEESD
ncbi:hypothetical protein LJB42_002898 [Komagataella kurtzmanii]|nr:hypothetical protein LJB42_002898 [Komagataella kurtzmanii]